MDRPMDNVTITSMEIIDWPLPDDPSSDTIDSDDQSSSGSGDSQSSGGLTVGQLIKVALGVLTLIAGAFLVTMVIRVRNQEDEPKFE